MPLGLYPVADSLALLADFGLQGQPALLALHAGAALDLTPGLLTLAAPPRHMGGYGARSCSSSRATPY
jgi:hypothetical protein